MLTVVSICPGVTSGNFVALIWVDRESILEEGWGGSAHDDDNTDDWGDRYCIVEDKDTDCVGDSDGSCVDAVDHGPAANEVDDNTGIWEPKGVLETSW